MPLLYTKKALVERIFRDLNNNFPDSDFSISDNEAILHIDQALAFTMVGQSFNLAKVEGTLVTPEAYITTYNITDISQDVNTKYWYATLPQPPVSLPLGYSITDVFFAQSAFGKSQPVFLIKSRRVAYREFMPMPTGVRGWVEGSTLYLMSWDGSMLSGYNLYVKMASTRTDDRDAPMNLPDDAIENIYNMVMDKLRKRVLSIQDVIQDQLPAGNKAS